ncbi:MAG: hypothetical protein ACK2UM_05020 [Anaerolineales bacterium]|jgi:hypothetical protein
MTETLISNAFWARLPTKQEALLVCSACIFPIHIWTTIVFLYNFPSLILKANLWQILGVLAYALVFALFESLLLFGFLVLLAAMLPRKAFLQRFVPMGTLLALVITGLALLVNTQFMRENPWGWLPVLAGIVFGLLASLHQPADGSFLSRLAERFTLIASLYILLDLSALLFLAASSLLL